MDTIIIYDSIDGMDIQYPIYTNFNDNYEEGLVMDEEFQEIQGIIGDIVSNTVKQVVCLLRMDKEISDLPGRDAISIWRCEGISEDDIPGRGYRLSD